MRCLTIADELRNLPGLKKEDIRFVCADEASGALAESYGYQTIVLHTDYRDMMQELTGLSELLGKDSPADAPILIVDSYHITEQYLQALRQQARIFLLDDMAVQAYPVDCVLNYNAFATKEQYRRLYHDTDTRFYAGSRYVPLRPQFRRAGYVFRERVQDILITTGGGDRQNIALQILKAIQAPGLRYHVVTGRYHPDSEAWMRREQTDPQLCVHHDVSDMASLMRGCDIAVTAGGTTIYELAAIGVPFLCFSYAQNQKLLTEFIGHGHIAGYCGAFHHNPAETLARLQQLMTELITDTDVRREMHENERKMVDGLGAVRIARLLTEL